MTELKRIIPLFKVAMSEDAIERSNKVMRSGFIGQGPIVEEFEKALQEELELDKPPITVNSGTSALHLALHILKEPRYDAVWDGYALQEDNWPGYDSEDEVLTSALTCTATNWPILANGLKIKWVDVDPETCNMSLTDLESKITEKTKIIMLIHWGGYPIDLDEVKNIVQRSKQKYGFTIQVIEDCAHAYLSKYKDKFIGSHGNICCFSFQAIKHLTTVDGGMLIVPNSYLHSKAKLLRWFGIDRDSPRTMERCEDDIKQWGWKFHANDCDAAVGLGNMDLARKNVTKSNYIAGIYDAVLKGKGEVEILKRNDDCYSSFWIYTLKVKDLPHFKKHMDQAGIMVSQVHKRNDVHSTVKEFKAPLPNLDQLEQEMISIPCGWWMTDEDINYVIETINKGW